MKAVFLSIAVLLAAANASQAQFHNNGIFRGTLTLPAQMVVTGTTPSPVIFPTTNVIWKVTLALPGSMVVTGSSSDTVVRKTLGADDVVNLALGRPLGSTVDPQTEVLALDVMLGTGTSGQFPTSRLIIYDTTEPQKSDAGITKVLGQNATLDWQTAYGTKVNIGFGLTTGTIGANGTAQNGLSDSSLKAGGTAFYKHSASTTGSNAVVKGTLSIEGQMKFVYTDSAGTHNFDGIVQRGVGRLSGTPLGSYSTPGFLVTTGTEGTLVKKTLRGNDVVNLALGRPLGTKLNKKTEVLALNATFETHGAVPQSQVVIYDPTQNGAAGITKVLLEYGTLDWQNAYTNKVNTGFGVATGTLGASGTAQNGLLDSDFQGAGNATGKHLFSVGDAHASPKGRSYLQGKLKFNYTDAAGTHSFDGIYVNGSGKVSGRPIGGF